MLLNKRGILLMLVTRECADRQFRLQNTDGHGLRMYLGGAARGIGLRNRTSYTNTFPELDEARTVVSSLAGVSRPYRPSSLHWCRIGGVSAGPRRMKTSLT